MPKAAGLYGHGAANERVSGWKILKSDVEGGGILAKLT